MRNWQDKKVIVVGAARQGLAASRYLADQGAKVVLTDSKPNATPNKETLSLHALGIETVFGSHPESLLTDADCICISGGVPLDIPFIKKARKNGVRLTNDAQLFFEASKAPVIGITGSAGKTTTTTLIGSIANAGKDKNTKVWVGGNIGNPLIDNVSQIQPGDCVVMELSSFQLELMDLSPHIALVLNITPNHLDRHKTMAAYTAAKSNILRFQTQTDTAILNRDDQGSIKLTNEVKGRLITFGMNEPSRNAEGTFIQDNHICFSDHGKIEAVMALDDIHLDGKHNQMNALAAAAAGIAAGFSLVSIAEGISRVEGIPHRLELVRDYKGVRWYNDSIATAPERVLAALEALKGPLVLLLGGRDKDLPWDKLANVIQDRKPKVILFGEAGEMIEGVLLNQEKENGDLSLYRYNQLEDAIKQAAIIAVNGEAVLLSPGGTSYDAFKDFEERGNLFRKMVRSLP